MEELKNDIEQVKIQLLTGIKLGRVDEEWGNMIIETCNRALTIHSVVVPKGTVCECDNPDICQDNTGLIYCFDCKQPMTEQTAL